MPGGLAVFPAAAQPPRGVAVVAHGLNMRPGAMDDLVALVNACGYDAYRVALAGHLPTQSLAGVRAEDWIGDMREARSAAGGRARELGVPLVLAAFSLGALAGLVEAAEAGSGYARLVLFAPAIAPTRTARLVRLLFPFPRVVLPSLAPRDARAHAGTPVAAYRALFALQRRWREADAGILDTPALVFAASGDELVDAAAIGRAIKDRGRKDWAVHMIDVPRVDRGTRFRHAIARPADVGTAGWMEIRHAVQGFLV